MFIIALILLIGLYLLIDYYNDTYNFKDKITKYISEKFKKDTLSSDRQDLDFDLGLHDDFLGDIKDELNDLWEGIDPETLKLVQQFKKQRERKLRRLK